MSEQPNQPTEEELPDDELEVHPDLREDFRRLKAIIRGNNKRDEALRTKGAAIDVGMLFLSRLDTFIETQMGTPQQSKTRLDFEIRFAEGIRTMYDQAIVQGPPPQQPSARAKKLYVPNSDIPQS